VEEERRLRDGDRTGETVAYPGPDGRQRLRRAGGWQRDSGEERTTAVLVEFFFVIIELLKCGFD
jgi:hypothetical protein